MERAEPEVLRIRDCFDQVLLVLESKNIDWNFLDSLLDPVSYYSAFFHECDANYADGVNEYFSDVFWGHLEQGSKILIDYGATILPEEGVHVLLADCHWISVVWRRIVIEKVLRQLLE